MLDTRIISSAFVSVASVVGASQTLNSSSFSALPAFEPTNLQSSSQCQKNNCRFCDCGNCFVANSHRLLTDNRRSINIPNSNERLSCLPHTLKLCNHCVDDEKDDNYCLQLSTDNMYYENVDLNSLARDYGANETVSDDFYFDRDNLLTGERYRVQFSDAIDYYTNCVANKDCFEELFAQMLSKGTCYVSSHNIATKKHRIVSNSTTVSILDTEDSSVFEDASFNFFVNLAKPMKLFRFSNPSPSRAKRMKSLSLIINSHGVETAYNYRHIGAIEAMEKSGVIITNARKRRALLYQQIIQSSDIQYDQSPYFSLYQGGDIDAVVNSHMIDMIAYRQQNDNSKSISSPELLSDIIKDGRMVTINLHSLRTLDARDENYKSVSEYKSFFSSLFSSAISDLSEFADKNKVNMSSIHNQCLISTRHRIMHRSPLICRSSYMETLALRNSDFLTNSEFTNKTGLITSRPAHVEIKDIKLGESYLLHVNNNILSNRVAFKYIGKQKVSIGNRIYELSPNSVIVPSVAIDETKMQDLVDNHFSSLKQMLSYAVYMSDFKPFHIMSHDDGNNRVTLFKRIDDNAFAAMSAGYNHAIGYKETMVPSSFMNGQLVLFESISVKRVK